MIIHEQFANHKSWLWLLPIVINFAFYLLGKATPVINDTLDVDLLIGANFLLSIIYMIIVLSIFMDTFKKEVKEKEVHHHHEVMQPVETEPEQTLEDYIHSIEDKSKALNFVVGRVYSKYHGGSRDLRAQLKIPSDWYNEFSLLGVGTETIDIDKLMELVTRFEMQLRLFLKTEKEVFGFAANNLKNLIRDTRGSDTIIDVLDRNDKDPVKSYYEGAVRFCEKIKHEVDTNDLHLVRNDYVPKDEDELAEIRGKDAPKKEHHTLARSKVTEDPTQEERKKETKKSEDKSDHSHLPAPNHKPKDRPKHP
jgi:hypothetical protein